MLSFKEKIGTGTQCVVYRALMEDENHRCTVFCKNGCVGRYRECAVKLSKYPDNVILHEAKVMRALSLLGCPNFIVGCQSKNIKVSSTTLLENSQKDPTVDGNSLRPALVLQYFKNPTMFEMIKNPDVSIEIIWSLFLQVVSAITVAREWCGLVHNDLHLSNIFVRPMDIQELSYGTETMSWKVKTHGHVAVIIDYGQSYIRSSKPTTLDISLEHVHQGFSPCTFDHTTDWKTFLISGLYFIKAVRGDPIGKWTMRDSNDKKIVERQSMYCLTEQLETVLDTYRDFDLQVYNPKTGIIAQDQQPPNIFTSFVQLLVKKMKRYPVSQMFIRWPIGTSHLFESLVTLPIWDLDKSPMDNDPSIMSRAERRLGIEFMVMMKLWSEFESLISSKRWYSIFKLWVCNKQSLFTREFEAEFHSKIKSRSQYKQEIAKFFNQRKSFSRAVNNYMRVHVQHTRYLIASKLDARKPKLEYGDDGFLKSLLKINCDP